MPVCFYYESSTYLVLTSSMHYFGNKAALVSRPADSSKVVCAPDIPSGNDQQISAASRHQLQLKLVEKVVHGLDWTLLTGFIPMVNHLELIWGKQSLHHFHAVPTGAPSLHDPSLHAPET